MRRNIIYLINPISGTGGKSSLQELITQRTRGRQIDFTILPTNPEGNYGYLIPLIEKEKITDIVVCGGDGTVSAVAAFLRGTDTRIGIIPMGSGNGLAFAAKIPKTPSKALDIIFAGNASPIDGFTINGRFSCMLCGIGFDAGVAHEFAGQKKRGLKTYIRISLAHFFKTGSYHFRIGIPDLPGNGYSEPQPAGYSFETEAYFISIANSNQFGNNFTIAPKASLNDGLLDIVVAGRTGKLRLILAVIRQVMGGYKLQLIPELKLTSTILYFQTGALTIANPQEAPLHIDGDPGPTAKEFVIRIVPKAIMLIQPVGRTR
jgi:diacylglycerol kinase (ATP)